MAENSKIEWTDHTFNPWIGCQKVGPGCDHCYAETWDARGMHGGPTRWGPHATRTRTSAANWRKPISWDKAAAKAGKRARVFCASLADVFDNHPSISEQWRDDLWKLIDVTPNLDWLLLTKRPGNVPRMVSGWMGPRSWPQNVWLGCTITSREEMLRDAPKLKAVPAAVRFWSVEPLLGDLGEIPAELMPNWIIVGGESGRHARPMHPDWARSLRDQAQAAGVPFLFKQWGEWADQTDAEKVTGSAHRIFTADGKMLGVGVQNSRFGMGAVEPGWKEHGGAWMSKVGKASAGRLLDGVEHNGMPEVAHG